MCCLCPFQWRLRMSRNQRCFALFRLLFSFIFIFFHFRCQSNPSVLFKSNENFCRLSLPFILYLFVSLLSNCTDCSVIVNMSIVSSWTIFFSFLFCVREWMGARCMPFQNYIQSHKWHSFRSDDNFKFSFCYLFSLLYDFFFQLVNKFDCVSSSSRWFVI